MNYITITDRDDGFGAQLQHILYGIMYAEQNNYEYIHKPISAMEHNYDNNPQFISKIEDFLGLQGNYKSIHDVHQYDIITFWPLYNFITADFNKYLENSQAIQTYKSFFFLHKKNPFTSIQKCEMNIAVHIRRPNICDNRIEGADTPDSYYLNLMQKIRDEYSGSKIFHIYSQGPIENFSAFCHTDDVVLHLNEDLCDTFLGLVYADILVMSKSAFSYSAAILSDGIVYFTGLGDLNPPCHRWLL